MKIAEVLLLEAYFDELEVIVQDRLAQYVGSDKNEIPSIDKDSITPKGKIPNDMAEPDADEEETGTDVAAMAQDQALGAVKEPSIA